MSFRGQILKLWWCDLLSMAIMMEITIFGSKIIKRSNFPTVVMGSPVDHDGGQYFGVSGLEVTFTNFGMVVLKYSDGISLPWGS